VIWGVGWGQGRDLAQEGGVGTKGLGRAKG